MPLLSGRTRNGLQTKGLQSSHFSLQTQLWASLSEMSGSKMASPSHHAPCSLHSDKTTALLGSGLPFHTNDQRLPPEPDVLRRPGEHGASKRKQETDSAGSGSLQSLRTGTSKGWEPGTFDEGTNRKWSAWCRQGQRQEKCPFGPYLCLDWKQPTGRKQKRLFKDCLILAPE